MSKTVVVIGAGKGLGNSVAELFAKNGFMPVLMARNEDSLQAYRKEFADKGIVIQTQTADAENFASLTYGLNAVREKFGMPEVIVYNVGNTSADENTNSELLVGRYRSDVAGAFHCVQWADTEEFCRNNGTILVTGGGLALYPVAGYLPLSMDKAALRAMVLALYPVLKEKGIHIGIVEITNIIGGSAKFMPDRISEEYWKLYTNREECEIIY